MTMHGSDRAAVGTTRHSFPREAGPLTGPKPMNVLAMTCGFAVLIGFAALFIVSPKTYHSVIDLWSFVPFDYPFIDAEYTSTQIECWRKGVDVYVANPCDALERVQNLPPIWLHLPFWPSDKNWTNILGLTIDSVFLLSLMALPPPRCARDAIPVLMFLISSSFIFALERANQDLIIFVLIIIAILLLERSIAARLLGYAAIVVATLLKIYPVVLLILLLREHFRTFLVVMVGAVGIIFGYGLSHRHELLAAMANLPIPATFAFGFGASRLPDAMGTLMAHLTRAPDVGSGVATGLESSPVWYIATYLVMLGATCFIAIRIAASESFGFALIGLTMRESLCLLSGAAVICGCFFAGTSQFYRGVFLLLALPGLFAMARTSPSLRVAWVTRLTGCISLLLMFEMPVQRLVRDVFGRFQNGVSFLGWMSFELLWWWVVAALLAILLRYAFTSQTFYDVTNRLLGAGSARAIIADGER